MTNGLSLNKDYCCKQIQITRAVACCSLCVTEKNIYCSKKYNNHKKVWPQMYRIFALNLM